MRHAPTDRAPAWRLLVEPDGDGATNMATDEALLDAYLSPQGRDAAPTLRLYGWNPANVVRPASLGANWDVRFMIIPAVPAALFKWTGL